VEWVGTSTTLIYDLLGMFQWVGWLWVRSAPVPRRLASLVCSWAISPALVGHRSLSGACESEGHEPVRR